MKAFIVVVAMLLAACAKDPETSGPSSNASFTVDNLFTKDGCSVYRFFDAGHHHYFVRCDNTITAIGRRSQICGKGCVMTVDEPITTNQELP